MASFEPDILLGLIVLAGVFLALSIIAAVLYLWKMLRKEARWPGLRNPYGWPVDMLGDIDANIVDKSVCKKRLRPSRLEKNAKKFHETLGDVLPQTEPPPVPARVDSLTSSDRRAFEAAGRQRAKTPDKAAIPATIIANPNSGGPKCGRQLERRSSQVLANPSTSLIASTSNASSCDESVKLRRDRKRSGSGYRDERRRSSPRNSVSRNLYPGVAPGPQRSRQRERREECSIEIGEDNEPPPPYSEVHRNS